MFAAMEGGPVQLETVVDELPTSAGALVDRLDDLEERGLLVRDEDAPGSVWRLEPRARPTTGPSPTRRSRPPSRRRRRRRPGSRRRPGGGGDARDAPRRTRRRIPEDRSADPRRRTRGVRPPGYAGAARPPATGAPRGVLVSQRPGAGRPGDHRIGRLPERVGRLRPPRRVVGTGHPAGARAAPGRDPAGIGCRVAVHGRPRLDGRALNRRLAGGVGCVVVVAVADRHPRCLTPRTRADGFGPHRRVDRSAERIPLPVIHDVVDKSLSFRRPNDLL